MCSDKKVLVPRPRSDSSRWFILFLQLMSASLFELPLQQHWPQKKQHFIAVVYTTVNSPGPEHQSGPFKYKWEEGGGRRSRRADKQMETGSKMAAVKTTRIPMFMFAYALHGPSEDASFMSVIHINEVNKHRFTLEFALVFWRRLQTGARFSCKINTAVVSA